MPVRRLTPLLVCALLACGRAPAPATSAIQSAIERAADQENVPRPLLLALAWTQSRWSMNPGHRSIDGGWGLFHLVEGPEGTHSIASAAKLTGLAPERLRTDPFANSLGAAALLRAEADRIFPQYRDLSEDRLGDWFEVVMLDSGLTDARLATSFAESVFHALRDGVTAHDGEGALARLEPQTFDLSGQSPWVSQSQDLSGDYCPNGACVRYVQAANYSAGRSGLGLQYVVIHDMEGYYEASIEFFTHPSTQASAHYDIRSSDGQITQQVRDADTAWHSGNWDVNQRSVGIEHEGFAASGSQWYTEAMYKSSAALTRWLCDTHHIPKTRQHIIGHYEVPNPNHAGWYGGADAHHDPCDTWAGAPTWHNVTGCAWNWDHYIALVNGGATPPPPPAQGTLAGFVGDACCGTGTGRHPLPGATIALAGTSLTTTADSAGNYSFKLNPGDYTPHASASGYQSGDHTSVGGTATVIVHGGQTTWGSVLLRPAAVARPALKITSPVSGSTVGSTPVRVTGTCSGAAAVHLGSKEYAVQNGAFTASASLVAGLNTVTVTATNAGGTSSASIHVTYGPPVTGVQGTVTAAATGAAVAGALVSLSSGSHTQSDAQGHYVIDAPPGTVTLTVQATGFVGFSGSVAVASGGLTTKNVALQATPTVAAPHVRLDEPLEGETFTQTPAPVRGAVDDLNVSIIDINGAALPVVAGAFSGTVPLVEGANTIVATAHNAGGAGSATVHVTYAPAHTGVQGTVTDSGTGATIAGATITSAKASAKSGGDGHFVLEMPSGETELVITAAGYQDDHELLVIPDEGLADLDVSLDPGTGAVAGAPHVSIWSPADGDLETKAAVPVSGAVDDPSVTSVVINGVPTPVVDGQFNGSADLKPGPNTIAVSATNAQGTATEKIAVTFDPSPSGVEGTVTAAGGGPIAFALVELQGSKGSAQTDAAGHYRIDADPGSYTLAVSAGGYAPATQPIDIQDEAFATVDVALAAVATTGAPPHVLISEPVDGQVVTAATVAVRGTLDDPGVGVVQIGGKPYPVMNGAFDGVAVLAPGANTITVSATSAGGTGTASVGVTYDVATSGVRGQVSSAADGSPVAGAVLALGGDAHADADGRGSYLIDAAPGDTTLTVTAAGYQTFTRPVTVASGAFTQVDVMLVPLPSAGARGAVHIASPSSGDHVPAGAVTVSGTAKIEGLRSLSVNGASVAPDAGGNFTAQVTVQAGDNQIYVRATDGNGTLYADAIYVTVDGGDLSLSSKSGCRSAAGDPALLLLAALGALWQSRRRRAQTIG